MNPHIQVFATTRLPLASSLLDKTRQTRPQNSTQKTNDFQKLNSQTKNERKPWFVPLHYWWQPLTCNHPNEATGEGKEWLTLHFLVFHDVLTYVFPECRE